MKISVIIPTHKPGKYFAECLESLSVQLFAPQDFEIIIILNGCNSPWGEEIKGNIEKYLTHHNVRFMHTDTPGVSNARNIGLDAATGEYICFIDDDDIISPNYLNSLFKHASTEIVSVSNIQDFTTDITTPLQNNNKIAKLFMPHAVFSLNRGRSCLSGPWLKLIHRDIIKDSRYDTHFKNGEDTLFMFDISRRIKSLRFADADAIYYYRRQRAGSAMNLQKADLSNRWTNIRQVMAYFKIFLRHPLQYNIPFFITRVGGALYAAFFLHRIIKERNRNGEK